MVWLPPHEGSSTLRAKLVNDSTSASEAMKLIQNGSLLIYQGDYHNSRRLLSALQRRAVSRRAYQQLNKQPIAEAWFKYREMKKKEAQIMNSLLLKVDPNHQLEDLKRTPENIISVLSKSCRYHLEDDGKGYLVALRDILGRVGAHEMYEKGIYVPQIDEFIHPHYEVFSPTRKDYLDLLDVEHLPAAWDDRTDLVAFDIGVGTGVLTAWLLKATQKFQQVVGTDNSKAAINCAKDNLSRMGLLDRTVLEETNGVFPSASVFSKADLLLCNPPWLPPGASKSDMDGAIFDNSNLLYVFLSKAQHHLKDNNSEAWLILSNLAELLQLRSRDDLFAMIEGGNLEVADIHTRSSSTKRLSEQRKSKQRRMSNLIDDLKARQEISLYRLRLRRDDDALQ